MKRIRLLASFMVLSILALAGCGGNAEESVTKETNEQEANQSYTVADDRGKEISFDKVPETVISLQPSNTEILFALGVGDKVIGVTDYDKWPEEVKNIEKVSDSVNVNVERVVELNPDVVFAYTIGGEEQVEQLESAGLKVFVIQSASSIEDIYGDIRQIAQVMGVEEKGNKLVDDIKGQLAGIKEKTAAVGQKRKVYFEIAPAPDIWSIGSGTFQQQIIEAAGVENIFADQQGWFSVTEEDVILRNPDAIITTVNYSEDPVKEILSRKGWESITAIQNGEVHALNADLLDRPGPRIAEAAELIAKTIYPELYENR